jgi:hypothetical protein
MRPIGASKGVEGIHVHNLRGARCVGGHHGRLFVRRDCIRDVVCQAKGTKRDKKPVVEQFRPPSKARVLNVFIILALYLPDGAMTCSF